jgi:hypothetical protein
LPKREKKVCKGKCIRRQMHNVHSRPRRVDMHVEKQSKSTKKKILQVTATEQERLMLLIPGIHKQKKIRFYRAK